MTSPTSRVRSSSFAPFVTAFVFSVSLCLCGSSLFASAPRLAKVIPPGGQKGTTVEVDFTGKHLEEPREVLFYEPGITVESVKALESVIGPTGKPTPVDPGTRVRVRLKLAGD